MNERSEKSTMIAGPRYHIVWFLFHQFPYEGQLAAGTCEIVTLDRDSSQPRRTIARQTARCACKKGQIAGTTRARPACVDAAHGHLVISCGGSLAVVCTWRYLCVSALLWLLIHCEGMFTLQV
uniref:TAFA chemokine like family member 5 n=1 Tax=Catharus ustulatus TaxID=91951 RepID=A0A8C3U5E9_CATUS